MKFLIVLIGLFFSTNLWASDNMARPGEQVLTLKDIQPHHHFPHKEVLASCVLRIYQHNGDDWFHKLDVKVEHKFKLWGGNYIDSYFKFGSKLYKLTVVYNLMGTSSFGGEDFDRENVWFYVVPDGHKSRVSEGSFTSLGHLELPTQFNFYDHFVVGEGKNSEYFIHRLVCKTEKTANEGVK